MDYESKAQDRADAFAEAKAKPGDLRAAVRAAYEHMHSGYRATAWDEQFDLRDILAAAVATESQSKARRVCEVIDRIDREGGPAWGPMCEAAIEEIRDIVGDEPTAYAMESKSVGRQINESARGLRACLDEALSLATLAAEPDMVDAIGDAIAIMDGERALECKSYGPELEHLRAIVSELQDFYDSHAPRPTRILRQAAKLENWIDAAKRTECRSIAHEPAEHLAARAENRASRYESWARHATPNRAKELKRCAEEWRRAADSIRAMDCGSVAGTEGER